MKLDAQQLLQQARSQTGLDDFGDPYCLQGLQQLVASINHEAKLSEPGAAAQTERIKGLLVNRLLLEQSYKDHPEILDELLLNPIVIVGLPRTGSTMTHRLLATDPAHTAMLWWEGRYPAMLPGEIRGQPEQRQALGKAEVQAVLDASKDAMAIHPWDYDAPDEEILLLEHTFLSTTPEAFMYLPSYSKWVEAQDHQPAYMDLKRMLQGLQWQNRGRAGKRWILKSPHHLGFIDSLLKVFPDANVVQTHRHPQQTVPSLCSMCVSLAQPLTLEPNHRDIGAHWVHKLSRATQHCLEVSLRHPEQFMHLQFAQVVGNPIAEMQRVYRFAGARFGQRSSQAMQAYRDDDAHQPGSHSYSLADYGLDAELIASLFARYVSHYDLAED